VWGQGRIDRFVASVIEEQCRIKAGCDGGDLAICAARHRAFIGDTSRCRYQGGLADVCLSELAALTCDDGPRTPQSCFSALDRCDVFFFDGRDTGFERDDSGR
jgi:hypothetical protein